MQVLTASRMWGKLKRVVPLSFATAKRIHRWSGRLARALHDPGLLPLRHDARLQDTRTRASPIHSIAGSFVYGVLAAKLLVIRWKGYPHWVLPVLGGSLAAVLTTLWLTSSLWYFTNVRFGF